MIQLLLAVDLMHRNNIIHRDLKLDNILLMDRESLQVSISDMGLACRADSEVDVSKKCGSPGYIAPEIFLNQNFTPKADIFSLGTVFYTLLTSRRLFSGRDGNEVLYNNSK